jgi:hypothetical protein
MLRHKYRIGQRVEFSPSLADGHAHRGIYEVTRLLPSETKDYQYRIKDTKDGQERVVRESQLAGR